MASSVDMDEIRKTVSAKLLAEGTSYGALQYLQSFVARKRKQMGADNTSQIVFYGASCLVSNGNGHDAGNALKWFVESKDLLHIDPAVKDSGFCDTLRLVELFRKFQAKDLEPCASVIYDPFHKVVVESKMTVGVHINSNVTKRMKEFDELCADIFEQTKVWRSAYRVCTRLNLIERSASILNSWSDNDSTYMHEKPLFFARAILTLLSEKRVAAAAELANASKSFMNSTDNAVVEPLVPGGVDSAYLACYHVSIILAELAALPPAPRVDKARLYQVLANLYVDVMDHIDSRLVDLLEKVGGEVFGLGKKEKQQIDPMNMFQAMMNAGGGGPSSGNGKGKAGQIGGMDVNQMLNMLNQMQGR